jgi:glycosidase
MSQLDYIQGMGFDCVWITPVSKQIGGISCNVEGYCGAGYHGYWTEDWWSIDPHLGTSDDLVALSAALHHRSMCLVLDVVANHARPLHSAANVSVVKPFDSLEHYHTLHIRPNETFDEYCRHPASCLVEQFAPGCHLGETTCRGYNAAQVTDGWFASLGDLKHENPYVTAVLLKVTRLGFEPT